MPGPPAGPSLRITSTSPATIAPAAIASLQASSDSKTRAGPAWRRISAPDTLTTAPSGARLPRSATSPPGGLYGCATVCTTAPSGAAASRGALGERAAADGRRVAVDQPGADQLRDHHRRAADLVQVGRHVAAGRAEAADHRRARADLDQLVELELDLRLARDREQVQQAVGRAAGGGDAGHRVAQRAAVEERARASSPGAWRALRARRRRGAARRGRRPAPSCGRAGRCRGTRRRAPSCWR